MPKKKKRGPTKREKAARRKKRFDALPEWKKRAKQQRQAGIKSGTSDQWRDPKTGAKVKRR
jgi:hypothetical protein